MPIDNYLVEVIRKVGPGAPSRDQKIELLQMARSTSADHGRELDMWLVAETEQLRSALQYAQEEIEGARKEMEKAFSPPFFPATFLRPVDTRRGPQALVKSSGSERVVECGPDVALDSLKPGETVLLSDQQNLVLEPSITAQSRTGELATFERFCDDGRVVLSAQDHREFVVNVAEEMDASGLKKGIKVRWNEVAHLVMEKVTDARPESLFLEETPGQTFEQIGGLGEQIESIKQTIQLHMNHAETARRYGLVRKRSALLVGPAGTGKTMVARALANWLATISSSGRSRFINIKPSGLHSMWYGKTEENYREVFRLARQAGEDEPEVPVVMFFDEVDSVGLSRGTTVNAGINDRTLTAFMTELDGLEDRGNILVLAATNRRGALDPALLRPGRLGDLILEIPRPNKEGTVDIFGKYLTENTPFAPLNEESPESIRQHIIGLAVEKIFTSNGATDLARVMLADGRAQIVERSDLVTGAVVAKIAQSAIEKACVREIQGGEPSGVTPGDVLSCVDEEFRIMASTLTRDNIRRYIPAIPDGIQVGSVEVLDKQTAPAEPVVAEQNGGEDVRA